MRRRHLAASIVAAGALALGACTEVRIPALRDAQFGDGFEVGELRGADMRETSGLVASQRHPGHFWLHNDSGNDAEVFLVDGSGAAVMRLEILGVPNRDWEDIARRGDTLFIAETGDNQARWDTVYVHAVLEPARIADTAMAPLATYPLAYPDGPRDVETLLVDPVTGDWFLVSKRDQRSRLYRAAAPHRQGALRTLERVDMEFPFRQAVGGDVSADGREVLIKSYDAVYWWAREGDEPLARSLRRAPSRQPYTPERQGEAIGFAVDASAYFTTSEVELDGPQLLLRYQRRER